MNLRSIKFGVATKSGMQTGHQIRFDREAHGGVTISLIEQESGAFPYLLKEFTIEEWSVIVACLSREYTDESYCEVVDRQLPYAQTAHEKAERLARRIT